MSGSDQLAWFTSGSSDYFTNSTSLGRQVLAKNDSSGLYKRRIVNQPLPGMVCIQLPRFTFDG